MSGYKDDGRDGRWLSRQMVRFFRNLCINWDGQVSDADFFDALQQVDEFEEAAQKVLFQKFKPKELLDVRLIEERQECSLPKSRKTADEELSPEERYAFDSVEMGFVQLWNASSTSRRCRAALVEMCDQVLASLEDKPAKRRASLRKDVLLTNVDEVCRVLKLDATERDALVYALVRARTNFDDFPCGRDGADVVRLYAMAANCPCSEMERALSPQATLRKFDLLDEDGDLVRRSTFRRFLDEGDAALLEGEFCKRVPLEDALPKHYYGALAVQHGAMLERLVCSGRAVNILLYGSTGTGKTSFVKTLAKALGRELVEIRQGDRDGERISPKSRLAGIRICGGQFDPAKTLLLVDEADQLLRTNHSLFREFAGEVEEKGVINSVLDETRLPTVWICNMSASALDVTVRRRFDYSIRFAPLGTKQRAAIWRNTIAKFQLGDCLSPEMAARFAEKYQTNAGGIATVLENVRRLAPAAGEAEALVDSLMRPHCELMGITPANDWLEPARDYSLEGLCVKGGVAPAQVVEAVRRFRETKDSDCDPDRPRMNLLLWGPPGTGKTEFVKHLGKALEAKVLLKSGSDILSEWVGGTEANLAAAFAEAEAENAILFLDEIDGLLQSRNRAIRSWEVTQVNELLTQMERFKGVFVGATNFMDRLDGAVLRRFTFKLQFDWLDAEGKRLFFRRFFKMPLSAEAAARLDAMPALTPGDFRTVRQSMRYLADAPSPDALLEELEKESALKQGHQARPIGF